MLELIAVGGAVAFGREVRLAGRRSMAAIQELILGYLHHRTVLGVVTVLASKGIVIIVEPHHPTNAESGEDNQA